MDISPRVPAGDGSEGTVEAVEDSPKAIVHDGGRGQVFLNQGVDAPVDAEFIVRMGFKGHPPQKGVRLTVLAAQQKINGYLPHSVQLSINLTDNGFAGVLKAFHLELARDMVGSKSAAIVDEHWEAVVHTTLGIA